jgi:filamentous hemagglutinin family protein
LAAISQPDATSLLIDQTSPHAILHFDTFSIASGNAVHFNNGSGSTLNRVTGGYVSKIDGALTATGSLLLINPNGVIVGRDGTIDTGGSFLASTRDVTNSDFLDGGDLTFRGAGTAEIVNMGKVSSLGGDVVFLAHQIRNEGTIEAPNGTAGLTAGVEILLRDRTLDDGKILVRAGQAGNGVTHDGVIRGANPTFQTLSRFNP